MYDGIAMLLAQVPDLIYDDLGGNIFLDRMPSTPDRAVALYPQPSTEPDSKLPYGPVEFQIVVRAEPGTAWALDTWQAIYSKLHGLRNTTLPDGTYAVFVLATSGSPFSLGDDENGRVQLAGDYRGEKLNQTEERP